MQFPFVSLRRHGSDLAPWQHEHRGMGKYTELNEPCTYAKHGTCRVAKNSTKTHGNPSRQLHPLIISYINAYKMQANCRRRRNSQLFRDVGIEKIVLLRNKRINFLSPEATTSASAPHWAPLGPLGALVIACIRSTFPIFVLLRVCLQCELLKFFIPPFFIYVFFFLHPLSTLWRESSEFLGY